MDTPNKLVSLQYNKLTPQLQFENINYAIMKSSPLAFNMDYKFGQIFMLLRIYVDNLLTTVFLSVQAAGA